MTGDCSSPSREYGKMEPRNTTRTPVVTSAETPSDSLVTRLKQVSARLPSGQTTLSEIVQLVGGDGLMLLACFLSLVFLIPVSIPGVSTVFGAGILLIALNRLFGGDLWLPALLRSRPVATAPLRSAIERALVWLHHLEKVSRPQRLGWLASGGLIGLANNCALILAAILLMAPFGLIPFSNTIPAVAVLFLAIGILQRDGVSILLGYVTNLLAIVYFSVILAGGGLAIYEMTRRWF